MRQYVWAAVAVFVAGLIGGSAFVGYRHGVAQERSDQAKALEAIVEANRKAWEKFEEDRKEIKVVYRERTKVIREAADPLGCLDDPNAVPDDIKRLLESDRAP